MAGVMSVWPVAHQLAALAAPGALESLRLYAVTPSEGGFKRPCRNPMGCTAEVIWALQRAAPGSLSVSEIRQRLGMRWTARRVNAILQRMVHRRDARVTERGNPKRYAWNR